MTRKTTRSRRPFRRFPTYWYRSAGLLDNALNLIITHRVGLIADDHSINADGLVVIINNGVVLGIGLDGFGELIARAIT